MIELYTAETPNGWKISIMLEELGIPYNVHPIALSKREQKQEWFLKLNPNGRIPAIVDTENNNFAVFESGAILIYLAEKYGKFLPQDPNRRSEALQWLMFQMSGIGPMMGQANVFYRYFPEKLPSVISRYQREVRRLFEVLNERLRDHTYLADEYSIADIATWPWVSGYSWSGVEIDGLDHLKRWIDLVGARPCVQKGRSIPEPNDLGSGDETTIAVARKLLE